MTLFPIEAHLTAPFQSKMIARATTERSRVLPICVETNRYYQMVRWLGCSALYAQRETAENSILYLTENQPFNSSIKDSPRIILIQREYIFNSCCISKLYKSKERERRVYFALIYLSCVWIARHIGFDPDASEVDWQVTLCFPGKRPFIARLRV